MKDAIPMSAQLALVIEHFESLIKNTNDKTKAKFSC